MTVYILAIFLALLMDRCGGNWMYLGVNTLSNAPGFSDLLCAAVPGLKEKQLEICKKYPQYIPIVGMGVKLAVDGCQRQFKMERWNCPTSNQSDSLFGRLLEEGTKETAYVYAITSAGVVYSVTRACSSGHIPDCKCDTSSSGKVDKSGKWKWAECNDNVYYGIKFAKQFIDAAENEFPQRIRKNKRKNMRKLMNLHNNKVGRTAVKDLMRKDCRCNGISGSCVTQVCRENLPNFRDVARLLKYRYMMAVEATPRAKRRLKRRGEPKKSIPEKDLVYIEKSPNFCYKDPSRGVFGTSGRICNRTSSTIDNCQLLCCGNGYNIQIQRRIERCNCKFKWCCQVSCDTCEWLEEVTTCK